MTPDDLLHRIRERVTHPSTVKELMRALKLQKSEAPGVRRALETLVHQGGIKCTEVDHDEYGRTVATCVVNGRDVGSDMVRSGWALDYPKSSRGAYLREQIDAIQAQRGLWSGSFMPPWEWRAR